MPTNRWIYLTLLVVCVAGVRAASPAVPVRRGAEPVVQLDPLGPITSVSALAFAPDGLALYAAGLDKVVYEWRFDAVGGNFKPVGVAFRVPIGPGREGSLNALAVSPDGRWLAVGGKGLAEGTAGFREDGLIAPSPVLSSAMRRDQGTIFLFDRASGAMARLVGHSGAVLSLAFVPGNPARLVSAAQEWNGVKNHLEGGLRLWDVAARRELARLGPLEVSAFAAPALASWTMGDEPGRVRVAVAWEGNDNEVLGIWQPSAKEQWIPKTKDKNWGNTVVYDSEGERLIAGSFVNPQGEVRSWKVTDAGKIAAGNTIAKFPPEKNAGLIPRALALFAARKGGPVGHAAVASTLAGQETRTKLAVVSLDDKRVVARRDVGPGCNRPVLATTPNGRHLAIALPPAAGIQIFSIPALMKQKGKSRELPTGGVPIRRVRFVRAEGRLGLLLATDRAGEEGNRVFDVDRRQLVKDIEAWKPAEPRNEVWSVRRTPVGDNGPGEFVVRRGNEMALRVRVPGATKLLRHALLPPATKRPWPILAVAYLDEASQPTLGLFVPDGKKGHQIRQLSGHLTAVQSLSFAADQPLLASAADDATACVWSLADLDRVIGKVGRLAGVAVKDDGGTVVVAAIEDDSPHEKILPKGTILEGIEDKGQVKTFGSAADFYRALARHPPGKSLGFRVRGPGVEAVRVQPVVLDQGIDERKPLFTFFQPDGKEWIGWNPLGPYDSATRARGEKAFGWHSNPIEPNDRVRFEPADQENGRKRYRRQGILKYLLARANLAEALEDWKKENAPRASMNLELRPQDPDEPRIDRQELVATLDDPDFPLEEVHKVEWQFDDGPWQQFSGREDADRAWVAAVPRALWKRGRRALRVRLFAAEEKNEPAWTESLAVAYQPPAPRIRFPAAWVKEHFGAKIHPIVRKDNSRFPVRALVEPFEGQSAKVILWHNKKPIPVELKVEKDLELEPNQKNVIGIEAINADAPHPDRERTVEWIEVTYAKTFVPAEITFAKIGASEVQLEETLRVTERQLAIAGSIKAEEALTLARRDGVDLAGFTAGTAREFSFREAIDLKPGLQRVVFSAKTKNTDAVSVSLAIFYRPALPEVALLGPTDGAALVEGRDPARVTLRARLKKVPEQAPFRVEVMVNGRVLARPAASDEAESILEAAVPLDGGPNRIGLRLGNEWGSQIERDVTILFRRPPRIVKVEVPHDGKKTFVRVVVDVRTAPNRPLTGLRVNDVRAEVGKPVAVDEQGSLWRVTSPPVPLNFGANALKVQAFNADGEALNSHEASVNLPPPPKAEIVLTPATDKLAESAKFLLGLRVRSSTALTRLEVRRDEIVVKAFDAAQLRPDAEGFYSLEEEVPVTLAADLNRLTVEADNAGGRQTAKVAVNYKQPPALVAIDRLVEVGASDAKHVPAEGVGAWTVERIKTGRVKIQGRVLWADPNADGLRKAARVRVFANGFQQLPTDLQPPESGKAERRFETELWLSRSTDNLIEIELPEVALAAGGGRRGLPGLRGVVQNCDAPISGQRLHLLPIALDPAVRPNLLDQALKTIRAVKQGDHWTASGFEEIHVYPLGNAEVTPGRLFNILGVRIPRQIRLSRRRPGARQLNDVVLIYYQGIEHVDAAGRLYFLSSYSLGAKPEGNQPPPYAIKDTDLNSIFTETLGAQVLLLDVARPSGTAEVHWPDGARFGTLRLAWLGPQGRPVPDEIRLLSELQKTPLAGTLKDLNNRLEASLKPFTAGRYRDQLRYEPIIPVALDNLNVGPPP